MIKYNIRHFSVFFKGRNFIKHNDFLHIFYLVSERCGVHLPCTPLEFCTTVRNLVCTPTKINDKNNFKDLKFFSCIFLNWLINKICGPEFFFIELKTKVPFIKPCKFYILFYLQANKSLDFNKGTNVFNLCPEKE